MNALDADPAIDIVYLWVDGSDPMWRAKRHAAALRLGTTETQSMAPYGNVEGRFRDNDELRYSLRALERFFPDHGHVYIVTDGQTPPWLRASSRLTVICHQDLLPAHRLPTFDSGNIESYIHRIPGLSERYFYLNDDVFFGAPVRLDHWFWPDGFYVAWSDDREVDEGPMRPGDNSLENASRLSAQWLSGLPSLAQADYRHTPRTFAHSPRPMLKSLLWRLEDEAPELFERVRSGVFRSWDNPTLVSDFVLRWALAHGLARIRDYAHLYLATGENDPSDPLAALVTANGQLDFFCVNDTTDDAHGHDPRLTQVRAALQRLFPHASPFEQLHHDATSAAHPGACQSTYQGMPHARAHPQRQLDKPGHRLNPETFR
ncbi:Stealth CR1 domain-containing protein [Hydrogenophaga sp.]|uniref:Stealth CR1 domain-containing protein n=1 Tax=Hydrogenophaga sp. TaxID=1904254 RepID=UPI0025C71F36|nr:Stealth CR1 domain-containing protein [Hydrogenophaga sp.]